MARYNEKHGGPRKRAKIPDKTYCKCPMCEKWHWVEGHIKPPRKYCRSCKQTQTLNDYDSVEDDVYTGWGGHKKSHVPST